MPQEAFVEFIVAEEKSASIQIDLAAFFLTLFDMQKLNRI